MGCSYPSTERLFKIPIPAWLMGKGTTCNSGPKPGVILAYPNRPIDKACPLSLAPVATVTRLDGPSLLP